MSTMSEPLQHVRYLPPPFVGDQWMMFGQGFAFEGTVPKGLGDDANLRDANPWVRLTCVFAQTSVGDFRNAAALVALCDEPDSEVRERALRLLGHVAGAPLRKELWRLMTHTDHDMRLQAFEAGLYACDLDAVPYLVAAAQGSARTERERAIDRVLSLVSHADEELVERTLAASADEQRRIVGTYLARARAVGGKGPVFGGEALALATLIERLEEACLEDEDDPEQLMGGTVEFVDMIEAMTGLSRIGLYDEELDGDVAALRAYAARAREHVEALEPGARWFFGHLVPESP